MYILLFRFFSFTGYYMILSIVPCASYPVGLSLLLLGPNSSYCSHNTKPITSSKSRK